jgi:ribosomal protein S18 acetylase RimI-like enzyme
VPQPFAAYDASTHGRPAEAIIREANDADLPGCAILAQNRNGGDLVAWERALVADLRGRDRLLLVAMSSGRPVGYASAGWQDYARRGGRNVPDGWYLTGLVVDPLHRRGAIGRRLTQRRLEWLDGRTRNVWYFANVANRPSLELHRKLGFHEVTRDFAVPGVAFDGGTGVLCVRGDV